jgi:predicted enzyme related to lactoylglutathione lyase
MNTQGIGTILYPVKDLNQAVDSFRNLLGAEPYIHQPYYAAFRAGTQDIGLDPNGHGRGMTGPAPFWHVTDIQESLRGLVAGGATELQPVTVVGPGKQMASVRDGNGNFIGLIQQQDDGTTQAK